MRSELQPHQRLKIRQLAASLGTSETPVREAIFQLVRDGALELRPHYYVRVRRLTLAEYLEIRDVRLHLQPLAAERAHEEPHRGRHRRASAPSTARLLQAEQTGAFGRRSMPISTFISACTGSPACRS